MLESQVQNTLQKQSSTVKELKGWLDVCLGPHGDRQAQEESGGKYNVMTFRRDIAHTMC